MELEEHLGGQAVAGASTSCTCPCSRSFPLLTARALRCGAMTRGKDTSAVPLLSAPPLRHRAGGPRETSWNCIKDMGSTAGAEDGGTRLISGANYPLGAIFFHGK